MTIQKLEQQYELLQQLQKLLSKTNNLPKCQLREGLIERIKSELNPTLGEASSESQSQTKDDTNLVFTQLFDLFSIISEDGRRTEPRFLDKLSPYTIQVAVDLVYILESLLNQSSPK